MRKRTYVIFPQFGKKSSALDILNTISDVTLRHGNSYPFPDELRRLSSEQRKVVAAHSQPYAGVVGTKGRGSERRYGQSSCGPIPRGNRRGVATSAPATTFGKRVTILSSRNRDYRRRAGWC
jgi:hypothetical protein